MNLFQAPVVVADKIAVGCDHAAGSGAVSVVVGSRDVELAGLMANACRHSPRFRMIGSVGSVDGLIGFFREHRPQVVILDGWLEGQEGEFAAATAVRRCADELAADTKVVTLARHAARNSNAQATAAGADFYVHKHAVLQALRGGAARRA